VLSRTARRQWTRRRASLLAALVVIASIVAVVAASLRADAVLGVAFARACAAESKAAGTEDRSRLRVDREDIEVESAPALAATAEVAKRVAPSPKRAERGRVDRLVRLASDERSQIAISAPSMRTPSAELAWTATDPPTRGRARLMVFLN
jgi:hypothetical protein